MVWKGEGGEVRGDPNHGLKRMVVVVVGACAQDGCQTTTVVCE